MSDVDLLDDYIQLGNSDNVDGYQPGNNKQKVDLTEYYRDTGQAEATVMVMGSEELSLGKLSKRTAALLGLQGVSNYDPFPSERNARLGAEGFFSTVYEGFRKFIETIIKYIKMAIDWVVDTVATIFGFRKSKRITKEIDDNLDAMKKEFEEMCRGLGLPTDYYNVEHFVGELKPGQDRKFQLLMMKSKFADDEASIKGLSASIPLLQQAMAKIKQAGDKATTTSKVFKKAIQDEFNRTRVRSATNNPTSTSSSTELNRLAKACDDVKVSLDVGGISQVVGKLYEALYNVKFSDEELTNGFSEVRKKLQETVKTSELKLTPVNVSQVMHEINYLNARYQEINHNEIDLSKINWKALGGTIDASDMQKVEAIANYFQFPKILAMYQETSVALRNFTQFCFNISQALMVVEKQITSLVEWHHRAHSYFYSMVVNDIEGIVKAVGDARAKGHNPAADAYNVPTNCVFIRDADAKTLAEKASANVNFIIKEDIGGVKTAINNFTKQTGWGSLL